MPYRKSSKTLNFGHQKLSVVDKQDKSLQYEYYYDRVQFANTYHVSAI